MNNADYVLEIFGKEIDDFNTIVPQNIQESVQLLSEADYNKKIDKLKIEIMDVDTFVKINDCPEVTNPIFFVRDGIPTPDGLLSNELFGISKDDRAGIFGYIDLGGLFIDPSCYKNWCKVDSKIKAVVHQTDTFIIDDNGNLVSDPKGKNGVKFLKDNFDKINIRSTDSLKRDIRIEYIKKNKDKMFINKYIVIPAYYRDMNTGSGGRANVGAINKLYSGLINTVRALKSTKDMGFDNTGAMCGRIQDTLVTIYDWFTGNTNPSISEEGIGISGKKGIMRRANLSKTADFSSRLVISAPELKVETLDDLMVDLDHSAVPLASALTNFKPFVIFNIKRFFENEFMATTKYPVINEKGDIEYYTPKDPLIEFSDERIEKEIKKFLHGYSDRFIPIEVPLEDTDKKFYMQFKGRSNMNNPSTADEIFNRRLTWCDVFYMAAVEASKDKTILITRFPIDSYFNQFPTKMVVSSIKETEPLYINDTYYPFYPKIRDKNIGSDTSNKFIDTLCISNLYLDAIGGDYDGDQATSKGVYTKEANEELAKFMNSKANYINVGGTNIRTVGADSLQSLYSLTKILKDTKLVNPIF